MRGKIIFEILRSLSDLAVEMSELTTAVICAGYGASYPEISFWLRKIRKERIKEKEFNEKQKSEKRRFKKMISALKQDDLIIERRVGNKRFVSLTPKGQKRLSLLAQRNANRLETIYEKQPTDKWIIVSFDIPEQHKRKRVWLRNVLKNLSFEMKHKSVWVGHNKIPKGLINDLHKMELIKYIEVFEATKIGSLNIENKLSAN
jgi:predicted transcriptional regulator